MSKKPPPFPVRERKLPRPAPPKTAFGNYFEFKAHAPGSKPAEFTEMDKKKKKLVKNALKDAIALAKVVVELFESDKATHVALFSQYFKDMEIENKEKIVSSMFIAITKLGELTESADTLDEDKLTPEPRVRFTTDFEEDDEEENKKNEENAALTRIESTEIALFDEFFEKGIFDADDYTKPMGDTSSDNPWSPTKDQRGIYECQSTTLLHELFHFISYDNKRKWESAVMSPYNSLPDARELDVDHIVDVYVTKAWTTEDDINQEKESMMPKATFEDLKKKFMDEATGAPMAAYGWWARPLALKQHGAYSSLVNVDSYVMFAIALYLTELRGQAKYNKAAKKPLIFGYGAEYVAKSLP